MRNPIKVAIDLHGTYDSDPALFNKIMLNNHNRDVNYVIFSGSPVNDIREQFATLFARHELPENKNVKLNIDYLSVVDECRRFGYPMIQKEVMSRSTGNMRLNWYLDGPDELWWPMKSVLCTMYDIDILIDDKPEYQSYFGSGHRTEFIRYVKDKYPDTESWNTRISREIMFAYLKRSECKYQEF